MNGTKKGLAALLVIILAFGAVFHASAVTLELTEEKKEEYYKQYVDIVEKAMQKKTGMGMEVVPIEQFQSDNWIEPKAFAEMVQNMVDNHLAIEREKINALSSTANHAVMDLNGKAKKIAYIYLSDVLRSIEVTGNFETQYSERHNRQLFAKVDNISTRATNTVGTWEQTSYEASLIDGGRTYSIRIEGIYSSAGVSFEKAFTIEFHCNAVGKIL